MVVTDSRLSFNLLMIYDVGWPERKPTIHILLSVFFPLGGLSLAAKKLPWCIPNPLLTP
jgi:hypothetical protein